ncbi:putative Heparan-alpha-glucosaminide N-acetyltransferase [Paratrimastix pyriformis]|uniref:Heparan-alpha-glucosaminide N-acetyltransferase n=1 Tax=Paratrimastix pyriformis TaxID=342808 RepID=A0ABQ8UAY2_9EUKA|nr:putative Heparan-alpha-glucosaminide N-acetyltransferase [Paratrimastix pyriformis]
MRPLSVVFFSILLCHLVTCLGVDQATVTFGTSPILHNISLVLSGVREICVGCDPEDLVDLSSSSNPSTIKLNTAYSWTFWVKWEGKTLWSLNPALGEHGEFSLTVQMTAQGIPDASKEPIFRELAPADPTFLPLIIAVSVMALLLLIWVVGVNVWEDRRNKRLAAQTVAGTLNAVESTRGTNASAADGAKPPPATAKPGGSHRVVALDAFRGWSLAIMILVNYGGGGYWFLDHSVWNGLTVADLVFPWFIFIMGAAIPLAFAARKPQYTGWRAKIPHVIHVTLQVLRRSITLFCIGLFLNNGHDLSKWRIPGVLQRFGISYLVGCLTVLYLGPTGLGGWIAHLCRCRYPFVPAPKPDPMAKQPETEPLLNPTAPVAPAAPPRPSIFADLAPHWLEWIFIILILLTWILITFFMEVPGCGRGYMGPGGRADGGKYADCTGGAAGYIDRTLLGLNHIYRWPTCQEVYETGAYDPESIGHCVVCVHLCSVRHVGVCLCQEVYETGAYDPEGILGCLTSIVLAYLGVQMGRILLIYKTPVPRLIRLVGWGVGCALIGAILCGFSRDGGVIPLNKNLWSLSFILVMGGTGYLCLALMYVLIDVLHIYNGAPSIYIGLNSITIYCCHELFANYFPLSWAQGAPTHSSLLVMHLFGVSVWHLVAYIMYRKKIFINV